MTTRVTPPMKINYWGPPPPVSERGALRRAQFFALPSAACPAWLAGFAPEDRTIRGSRLEHQILVGWPWPAATFRRLILEGPTEHMTLTNGRWHESDSGAPLSAASLRQKLADRLPLRIAPIPLACSLAAWIVAFALVALARQLIRRQRGNCGICGYDVKSLPRGTTCPECGGLASNA